MQYCAHYCKNYFTDVYCTFVQNTYMSQSTGSENCAHKVSLCELHNFPLQRENQFILKLHFTFHNPFCYTRKPNVKTKPISGKQHSWQVKCKVLPTDWYQMSALVGVSLDLAFRLFTSLISGWQAWEMINVVSRKVRYHWVKQALANTVFFLMKGNPEFRNLYPNKWISFQLSGLTKK